MENHLAISLVAVSKQYGPSAQRVTAVSKLTIQIPPGEYVSVMGPSGCGKSTLLNLIAGLETPTEGQVIVAGRDLAQLSDHLATS